MPTRSCTFATGSILIAFPRIETFITDFPLTDK